MAAEVSGLPNGNYGLHQSYNAGGDQNSFSYSASNQNSQPPSAQQAPPASSTPSNAQQQQTPQPDIPKDEVGWYFVEQYYTTLSRTPEKLYLFYNKRSQFVSGQETDKVAVCVGQRAINDKIRDLDLNDCKVRVTNVDSQASDSNIVIQVIGELSNRGQPHKKFTQTFVLATQTNGYFVLNDIFRYLVEEEDEAEAETQQPQEEVQQVSGTENGTQESAPTESAPTTLTSSNDPASIENAAEEVDEKIEEKLVNGTKTEAEDEQKPTEEKEEARAAIEEKEEEEAPAAQPEAEPVKELEKTTTAEADVEQETPKDPEPTGAPTPPKQETQKPASAPAPKPAAPAVPKTWASLAASAAKTIAPVVPQPVAQAAKTVQQKAAAAVPTAPAAAVANAITPNTPSAPSSQDAKGNDSQDEWTAVGSGHNRNASKQTNAAPQQQEPQYRGYIKNVADNVEAGKLKAELEKFGEVTYFDIARQKNCAFVDFKTADAYNKAKAAQFEVDGNDVPLFVEERKFRPGSTPYIPRGQYQGGRGGSRGGANQGAPRGNFQGGRGGQGQGAPRGRGGYAAAGQRGGRGGTQA
ncbi:Putative Ras GTPase-activating protein-binding protein [Septoria linicola]|uniref:Ras GTPase-activating protein-binding protein n=1 Tax=Septoria linicola TaxID=215465 RepID=A0A9Q9AKS2_9PEZI|nr:putative Ras GTPase-activating protein-binding protein [Septoria linicola]USW47953.1 Putative Ras GTPase-activating protein-binding protein [Septoria linicola]